MDLVDKIAALGSQLSSPAVKKTKHLDVYPESSQILACATAKQQREKTHDKTVFQRNISSSNVRNVLYTNGFFFLRELRWKESNLE